ncbi:hypothetical protein ABPG75_006764 [Micractinium tetrahymenae]
MSAQTFRAGCRGRLKGRKLLAQGVQRALPAAVALGAKWGSAAVLRPRVSMGPPNPRPYSPEPTEDDGRASTLEKAPTHVEDRIRSEVEQKYVLAGIEKKLGELGQGLEKMDRKVAKLDEKVESLMLGTSAYQKKVGGIVLSSTAVPGLRWPSACSED